MDIWSTRWSTLDITQNSSHLVDQKYRSCLGDVKNGDMTNDPYLKNALELKSPSFFEMQLGAPFSVAVERHILWLGEPDLVDYLWPVPYYNNPRAPSSILIDVLRYIMIYSHIYIYILWCNMYEWAVTTHRFAEYIWCPYAYVYIYSYHYISHLFTEMRFVLIDREDSYHIY